MIGSSPLRTDRTSLIAAGVLGLLSLGLPWERFADIPGTVIPEIVVAYPTGDLDVTISYTPPIYFPTIPGGTVPGTDHPMRLIGLAAALLLWWAIRVGSRGTGWLALAVGALAVPLGLQLGPLQSGRFCYLVALVCAAVGAGLVRPPGRWLSGPWLSGQWLAARRQ
jgi:hypothetical protein